MTTRRAPASAAHHQGSATRVRNADPKPPINILDAIRDDAIFAPWFRDDATWTAWFAVLRAIFGLPLSAGELELFRACTGRTTPRPGGYLDVALVVGRRGGKSLISALISVYLACFYNWAPFLTGGERGCVMIIAADRRQAAVLFKYLRAMLDVPLLRGLIQRETLDAVELSNGVNIEIQTASFKTIRGRTVLAAIADELAFWSDETSQNPDTEILAALRPAMLTVPGARLVKCSSPYSRRGALWNDYRKHFGRDDSATLVWQASTEQMNPGVDRDFIRQAYEDDPIAAAAEYGALFRTDVDAFVTREAVEACVVHGRHELPPLPNVRYFAFVDPSGGSADSMTLAIAHREGEVAVLDVIREAKPPFSPEAVVFEFSQLLRQYKVWKVVGDRFAGLWPRERFETHQVSYDASAKAKSDIYRDVLPLINGKRVELLDHPKLVSQLCALERRTARGGRDSIDHPPGQHDDLINAAAGALTGLVPHVQPARYVHLNFMGR